MIRPARPSLAEVPLATYPSETVENSPERIPPSPFVGFAGSRDESRDFAELMVGEGFAH
jgi:hypothetical protein